MLQVADGVQQQQPAAGISSWAAATSSGLHDSDAMTVRAATFATPIIVLGCDVGKQQLAQLCRSATLQLQVHDRTALPDPAPFTAARMAQRQQQLQQQQQQAAAAAAASAVKGGGTRGGGGAKQSAAAKAASLKASSATQQQQPPPANTTGTEADSSGPDAATSAAPADEGEVFGAAAVSLVDLARGRTACCFALPLRPMSTIRGGSCLDWKGRPGRYLEVRGAAS